MGFDDPPDHIPVPYAHSLYSLRQKVCQILESEVFLLSFFSEFIHFQNSFGLHKDLVIETIFRLFGKLSPDLRSQSFVAIGQLLCVFMDLILTWKAMVWQLRNHLESHSLKVWLWFFLEHVVFRKTEALNDILLGFHLVQMGPNISVILQSVDRWHSRIIALETFSDKPLLKWIFFLHLKINWLLLSIIFGHK